MSNTEYNGWTNWDTWNTYNWLTEEPGIYRSANGCYSGEDMKFRLSDYISNVGDDIDVEAVNWDELYEAFQDN